MDYKAAYYHLYNTITDALGDIELAQTNEAVARLQKAQQRTELMYMNAKYGVGVPFPKRYKLDPDKDKER